LRKEKTGLLLKTCKVFSGRVSRKDGKSGRLKVVHPSPRLWMINKVTEDKESGEVGKKEGQFNLKK